MEGLLLLFWKFCLNFHGFVEIHFKAKVILKKSCPPLHSTQAMRNKCVSVINRLIFLLYVTIMYIRFLTTAWQHDLEKQKAVLIEQFSVFLKKFGFQNFAKSFLQKNLFLGTEIFQKNFLA